MVTIQTGGMSYDMNDPEQVAQFKKDQNSKPKKGKCKHGSGSVTNINYGSGNTIQGGDFYGNLTFSD